MKLTIRNKLILAISILVVVLFSLSAYLFINEKKTELAEDIYVNSLAFAKLTAGDIANNYELYLAQDAFVYFNREIKKVFEQNADLGCVKVVSYSGEILYDSLEDETQCYSGKPRLVMSGELLNQVQSERISFKTLEGRVVYLFEDELGNVKYVDADENEVQPRKSGVLVDYFVVPATEKYSIIYGITYEHLDERIARMAERIVYLALFGVILGMLLSFVMSGQITRPISKLVEGVNRIARGEFSTRVDIKTHDEIKFLGDAVNKMAGDLEESMEAKLYQERVANELKIATDIQKRLIPKIIPPTKGLEIAAGIIPAEEIGGDMYDFIPLGEDKLLMYLGDVTGHGVPAGIVSSVANALFFGYSDLGDLRKVVLDVNKVLKAKTMPNMFMTLCLMEWDSKNEKFKYVSAGHEQILHYRKRSNSVELKPAGGIALGMMDAGEGMFKEEFVDLEPGDFMVIYSDGIPEAWRNEKENYGMEKFMTSVKEFGDLETALGIKEAILADVKEFMGDYKQMDDITLIVLKRL